MTPKLNGVTHSGFERTNFLFKSTPESGEIDKVLSAKSMAAIMLIGCLIETLTFCSSFKSRIKI
jgi:hypothetical protein